MRKSDISYIVGCIFVTMTAIFYCCTMWFPVKLPLYYPLEHTWKWVKQEGVPSQGWYGAQMFAFLAAGVIALVAYVIVKYAISAGAATGAALTRVIGLVTTLIVIICMGYMLYYEFSKWGVFSSIGFP